MPTVIFTCNKTPSTLQLDLESSVQCSDVALCLFFHLLLDEGSMMIFKIIISPTVGQGQFRHPLSITQGHRWSHPFGFLGIFLEPGFLLTPIWLPQSRYLFPALISVLPPSLLSHSLKLSPNLGFSPSLPLLPFLLSSCPHAPKFLSGNLISF